MTPLQLALTSVDEMDAYIEGVHTVQLIADIKAYSNVDRTVIATAINSNLAGAYYLMSDHQRACTQREWLKEYGGNATPAEATASDTLKFTDALIAALNKQP